MKGLVLFGYYPALPSYIRDHGRQASFGGGHAMALLPDMDSNLLPPHVSEFTLEFGPITGCTESSAAMVAAWASGINAIAQPATRETLQSAMGAQTTGVTPAQLQAAIQTVLHITTALGSDWSTVAGIGTYAWLGDPLAASWMRVPLADLKPFCTGKAGIVSPYQTVIFTRNALPDTATEDPVWYSQIKPYPASHVVVPAGKFTFKNPTVNSGDRYATGPYEFDTTFYVDGVAYGGSTKYLVYSLNAGGFACVPEATVTVTPIVAGHSDAELKQAAADGFALAKDKAAKAVNGITQ